MTYEEAYAKTKKHLDQFAGVRFYDTISIGFDGEVLNERHIVEIEVFEGDI